MAPGTQTQQQNTLENHKVNSGSDLRDLFFDSTSGEQKSFGFSKQREDVKRALISRINKVGDAGRNEIRDILALHGEVSPQAKSVIVDALLQAKPGASFDIASTEGFPRVAERIFNKAFEPDTPTNGSLKLFRDEVISDISRNPNSRFVTPTARLVDSIVKSSTSFDEIPNSQAKLVATFINKHPRRYAGLINAAVASGDKEAVLGLAELANSVLETSATGGLPLSGGSLDDTAQGVIVNALTEAKASATGFLGLPKVDDLNIVGSLRENLAIREVAATAVTAKVATAKFIADMELNKDDLFRKGQVRAMNNLHKFALRNGEISASELGDKQSEKFIKSLADAVQHLDFPMSKKTLDSYASLDPDLKLQLNKEVVSRVQFGTGKHDLKNIREFLTNVPKNDLEDAFLSMSENELRTFSKSLASIALENSSTRKIATHLASALPESSRDLVVRDVLDIASSTDKVKFLTTAKIINDITDGNSLDVLESISATTEGKGSVKQFLDSHFKDSRVYGSQRYTQNMLRLIGSVNPEDHPELTAVLVGSIASNLTPGRRFKENNFGQILQGLDSDLREEHLFKAISPTATPDYLAGINTAISSGTRAERNNSFAALNQIVANGGQIDLIQLNEALNSNSRSAKNLIQTVAHNPENSLTTSDPSKLNSDQLVEVNSSALVETTENLVRLHKHGNIDPSTISGLEKSIAHSLVASSVNDKKLDLEELSSAFNKLRADINRQEQDRSYRNLWGIIGKKAFNERLAGQNSVLDNISGAVVHYGSNFDGATNAIEVQQPESVTSPGFFTFDGIRQNVALLTGRQPEITSQQYYTFAVLEVETL